MLQVIAAFGLGLAVLAIPSRLVIAGRLAAAAGAGLALATLGGYLLSVAVGLFGFKEVRTTAGIAAGLMEVAAFVVVRQSQVGHPNRFPKSHLIAPLTFAAGPRGDPGVYADRRRITAGLLGVTMQR